MKDPSTITDAELRSAIKRIDDRLMRLAQKGFKNTNSYKGYEDLAKYIGGSITVGKKGYYHLSVGRISKLTLADKRRILMVDRKGGSYGKETQRATNYLQEKYGKDYIPTHEEVVKTAEQLSSIHDFILENDNMIYTVEKEYGNIVTGNDGELTPQQVDRLFNVENDYNEIMKARQQEKFNKQQIANMFGGSSSTKYEPHHINKIWKY